MDQFAYSPTNPSPTRPCAQFSDEWLEGRLALIFSAYRRDDYQNPEVFLEQAKMNLRRYPVEVVEYVTDPITGIQARNQWPPSLAEIVKACEAELIHLEKVARYSAMPAPLPRLAGPKFSAVESYTALVEKHGRPFGPFEQGRQLPYGAK